MSKLPLPCLAISMTITYGNFWNLISPFVCKAKNGNMLIRSPLKKIVLKICFFLAFLLSSFVAFVLNASEMLS